MRVSFLVCVCVSVHVCSRGREVLVCVYSHFCGVMYVDVAIHKRDQVCMRVYLYTRMHVYLYTSLYAYTNISIHVMHTRTYAHTHMYLTFELLSPQ